jgi:flavin reductase (DIM6/NTAB) family NADH-FMN oxidoreductase RutF
MHSNGVGDALNGVAAQFASGVTVVFALTEAGPFPSTASSFAIVSLNPPLATLALRRNSRLASMLTAGSAATVSVLRASDYHLAARFSRSDRRPGWGAFAGIQLLSRGPRPPVLVSAAAWVDAQVLRPIEMGDHVSILM